ncbi:glycerate 3-kinase [Escherichia coli]|uniref:glycerate 3-kinase n=1 Tax=Escherichia coli TaxID=562 RepID=UPI0021492740|nr:glycerate 3-kinase [Escherichia coli]MCR1129172.1 glycerate 3-kinase [Escherichia coli]
MKIVIAPDSFKESLSAEKCCQAIKAGFSTLFPDANYICLPIADGGEGTVDAMVAATGGNIVTLEVCGPMGEKVNAFYGLTGDGKTAVIEMAAASGLMLVAPEKRNPLLASSFGTGELIRHALDNDIRHIILGIGGSATVDGGMGMAQALGVRFLDADGQVLAANGGNLARVASIEMEECDPRLANCHIEVACDVDNPLVGARGAAAVFGPQKGATPEMVEELEQGLQITPVFYNSKLKLMSARWRGGAAGGMGIAAAVFLNADIKPGIEIVLNAVNLAQAVQGAALVITGEGRIDSQTAGGKAPLGVASVAKQFNVPVIGIAGVLGDGVEVVHQYGIDAVFSILPRLAPLAEVLASGETNLFNSARNIACAIKIGQGIKN